MRDIYPGQRSPEVVEIRRILERLELIAPTSQFSRPVDPAAYDETCVLAIRQFQQERDLVSHGIIDLDTYRELLGAQYRLGDRALSYQSVMQRGDDVRELQLQLAELGFHHGNIDGIFGHTTERSLRRFQGDYGMVVDGVCGAGTARALHNLLPMVTGGSLSVLASRAFRRTTGPKLDGRYIMLDAGRPNDATGADFVSSVVAQVRAQLELLGANAVLAQDPREERSATDRSNHANDVGAEVYLTIDVASYGAPNAEGAAAYYYGSPLGESSVGHELAGLLQREVTTRTRFTDLGEHPRAFETLRATRMPSVYLELGYLTNPGDRARMADECVRGAVAASIVAGLQRFYLLSPEDYPSGTWQIPLTPAE